MSEATNEISGADAQQKTEAAQDPAASNGAVTAAELEALENVDFLLEEIENKIAPLALA